MNATFADLVRQYARAGHSPSEIRAKLERDGAILGLPGVPTKGEIAKEIKALSKPNNTEEISALRDSLFEQLRKSQADLILIENEQAAMQKQLVASGVEDPEVMGKILSLTNAIVGLRSVVTATMKRLAETIGLLNDMSGPADPDTPTGAGGVHITFEVVGRDRS